MFRAFFKFREGSQGITSLGILGIINLNQDGAVTLNDEGVGGIVLHSQSTRSSDSIRQVEDTSEV
jgi:hypothetical protein